MRLRTPVLLAAVVALFASLLAALPAEAAGRYYAFVTTRNIALKSDGTGKVAVSCHSRTNTCKGKISFANDSTPRVRSYKVARGRTAYVAVALRPGGPDDPHQAPRVPGRDFKSVGDVKLKVDEDFPNNTTHYYPTMTTETALTRQDIRGTVQGQGTLATDIRVDLVRTVRGGNVEVLKGQDVEQGRDTLELYAYLSFSS